MAPRTHKNFELKSAKSFAMGVPVSPGKMVMDVEMAALDTASVMTVFFFRLNIEWIAHEIRVLMFFVQPYKNLINK